MYFMPDLQTVFTTLQSILDFILDIFVYFYKHHNLEDKKVFIEFIFLEKLAHFCKSEIFRII